MSFDDLVEDDNFLEEEDPLLLRKSSYIMLIDGSPSMFQEGTNYFSKSLEACMRIVRQLCCFNKPDKMCIGFYSSSESNCNVPNLTLIQEFRPINVDFLKSVKCVAKEDQGFTKELAIEKDGCLFEAINFAYRTLTDKKLNMTLRKIYVFTCRDNVSRDERRKIEGLINTFHGSNIKFHVVGLSENWDDTKFFRELQIIAGTYANSDYERLHLKDLESKIIYPVRSTATLKMFIHEQDGIDVSIYNLIGASKYPVVEHLSKDGEFLGSETKYNEIFDNEATELDENRTLAPANLQTDIKKDQLLYRKQYGQEYINFTEEEKKSLPSMGLKTGIHFIGFVPISCDPTYFAQPSNYISCRDTCNEDQKVLFLTLVKQCNIKNLMAICRITNRSTKIYSLIPSEDEGGFYANVIPSKDCVDKHEDDLAEYKFDEFSNRCPKNLEAVRLFTALIEANKSDYDPYRYLDPSLESVVTHLEALAFKEPVQSVEDTTMPKFEPGDPIVERLRLLLNLDEPLKRGPTDSPQGSQSKKPKVDFDTMKTHYVSGTVQKLTVAEIKDFLLSVNESTGGTKATLIQRVNDYFR